MVFPHQRQIVSAICNFAKRSIHHPTTSPSASNGTLATVNSNHHRNQNDGFKQGPVLRDIDPIFFSQQTRQLSVITFDPRWIFASLVRDGCKFHQSTGTGSDEKKDGFEGSKHDSEDQHKSRKFGQEDIHREYIIHRNANAFMENVTFISAIVLLGITYPRKYAARRGVSEDSTDDSKRCRFACPFTRSLISQMKEWSHNYRKVWSHYFNYTIRHAVPRVIAVTPAVNSKEPDLSLPSTSQIHQFHHSHQYHVPLRQIDLEQPVSTPLERRRQLIAEPHSRSESHSASSSSGGLSHRSSSSTLNSSEEFWEKYSSAGTQYADFLVNLAAAEEIKRNPQLAFKCWKSCDGRLASALFNLGVVYEKGDPPVGRPDLPEAFHHYKLAARMGHKYATYNLALFYIYGRPPVEQDVLLGHKLMTRAAYMGVKQAQKMVIELEKFLSPRSVKQSFPRPSSSPNLTQQSHSSSSVKFSHHSELSKKSDSRPSLANCRTSRIHLDSTGSSHADSDPEQLYDPFIEMVLNLSSPKVTTQSYKTFRASPSH